MSTGQPAGLGLAGCDPLVDTLNIVVGTNACDANCQFCMVRQTTNQISKQNCIYNKLHRNLKKACLYARQNDATDLVITGNGEPCLSDIQITKNLIAVSRYRFQKISLQTNGIRIGKALGEQNVENQRFLETVADWIDHGLDTVAISTVGVSQADNSSVYTSHYPPLDRTVRFLRSVGFTVRLSVVMISGMVDSPRSVMEVIEWCQKHDVGQLTLRPVSCSPLADLTKNEAAEFAYRHRLDDEALSSVIRFLEGSSPGRLSNLPNGASVYDIGGQRVCFMRCATAADHPHRYGTLIFYPNGRLTYDWIYDRSAVILQGDRC
jgi:molybdenum cofactor biosynthesis enzyme MoaA